MSLVTITWTAIITLCLSFGAVQLSLWQKDAGNRAYLGAGLSLLGITSIAMAELMLMRSNALQQAFSALEWANASMIPLLIGVTILVHVTLGKRHLWLAGTAIGLRLATALLIRFWNLPPADVPSAVTTLPFLGENVSVISAYALSRWWPLNTLSNFFVVLYLFSRARQAWTSGDSEKKRLSLWLGGSLLFFAIVASTFSWLINNQVIHSPFL